MTDRGAHELGSRPPAAAASLPGRRAAVVGVESAVGAAIARALGSAGADVALCALRADEGVLVARGVQRELTRAGRRAATYVMDVTLGRNVQVTTRQIAKEFGGLDLVVSASGLPRSGPLSKLTEVELAQLIALNFTAHLFLVRSASPELARAGGGTLLLLTHEAGARGDPAAAAFAAAQAATRSLVASLAGGLAEEGVALAAISLLGDPGAGIAEQMREDEAASAAARAVELAAMGTAAAGRIAPAVTASAAAVPGEGSA